ncbi:hypothetical protein [Paracoccus yeei]|uniref:hypothetical protein n=1 Tax=Paracoccus yeei TaxID=147645 RepID=UPI000EA3D916|nr:hypothetical protein [Paracoccus yeei]
MPSGYPGIYTTLTDVTSARRLGISPPQLFGWRKAFLNKQGESDPGGSPASHVELVVGDVTIRISPDLSEAALRRILRAVRTA